MSINNAEVPKLLIERNCIHCGLSCDKDAVVKDNKSFCCQGCAIAYEIASSSCEVQSRQPALDEYAFLDNLDIQSKLLRKRGETHQEVVLPIPAIHCSTCVWLLEDLPNHISGIVNSSVNFFTKEVTVLFDSQIVTLREIVEKLVRFGYAPEINRTSGIAPKTSNASREMWLRMGLAGFAFGNIMLFSLPEYFSSGNLEHAYQTMFAWLNLILATPVLFYSANLYLKGGWMSIKYLKPTIDLPISIGILALYLRSAYDILSGTGAGYMDSFAGFVFLLLLGRLIQHKTHATLAFDKDYNAFFPMAVRKKSEEGWVSTAIENVEKGDVIRLRNGELVPTDALLHSSSGTFDYSFITGESDRVKKILNQEIMAGARVDGKTVEIVALSSVDQSNLTRMWNKSGSTVRNDVADFTQTNGFAGAFTIGILLIALGSGVFWYFYDASMMWPVVTSVLIIACPCALALSPAFSYGTATGILSSKGFYARSPAVLQHLAETTDIVFDKTGTLTSSKQSTLTWEGKELSIEEKLIIGSIAEQSTHPLSVAISEFLDIEIIPGFAETEEIPAKGLQTKWKGNVWKLGSQDFVLQDKSSSKTSWNPDASEVHISVSGNYLGCFLIHQPLRKGVDMLLQSLTSKYKIHLLSGDTPRYRELFSTLFSEMRMFFGQNLQDKSNYISQLKEFRARVLMVGDGLNDSGALTSAHVGIAVSDSTAAFTPGSDIILRGDAVHNLDYFMSVTKKAHNVVTGAYILSILYNGLGIWFAVQGLLSPLVCAILMPASSITVILFSTGSLLGYDFFKGRSRS